jgi:predicted GTPase
VPSTDKPRRVVIMGAAGRDFHNFLVALRDDPTVQVVAFTATQIPGIDDRLFPAALAGPRYPAGVPIVPESRLAELISEEEIDEVVFAYSDISNADLMHKAAKVLATGADFRLMGPDSTSVQSTKPVISICAVRTGVGKSGISRRVFSRLAQHGLASVDIRHPMPYRDLTSMKVERYGTLQDLDDRGITIEEREEYEHMVEAGAVVMAGVDYEAIVREAEKEADVVVWDGGNNDLPFYRSDLEIVAVDPHRLGDELSYYPGETNFLRADVVVIAKVNTAVPENVEQLVGLVAKHNPSARIVKTASTIDVPDPEMLRGKRVLAIEDGPTVTHGGMAYGAAALAAEANGAQLVDPAPYAVGSLRDTFAAYPHLHKVLPAVGYSAQQLADLEATIAATPCDLVLVGTPIDLIRLIKIPQPSMRATYRIDDAGSPTLDDVIDEFLRARGLI